VRRRIAIVVALAACGAAVAMLPNAGSAADARSSVRKAALRWAVDQVGLRERGTTNCGPAINRWQRDMGLRVPPCRVWCGAFVHQAFLRAGVKLSRRMIDPDRAFRDAVRGKRRLRRIRISAIRPGDIVFYKFRPRVRASHLAIARSRPRNGKLDTVEGNTSHAVRLETRGTRYIVLAARVKR
jgi:hypothetical protein